MSDVLLFSAGLDSFPAWHYLDKPPALYFDLGHRYRDQERAAITALVDRCGVEVSVSRELDLSRWEADDAIIPLRNVYLAMLAANRAERIWCVGVKGDATADKSPQAFRRISQMITDLSGRPVWLDSPFWQMTKTEIVAWYLGQGLPAGDLLLTFSCSRTDSLAVHCGQCSSCLRRWISLVNNGVDAPFETDPWTWARVADYYVSAMRDGTYPDHRAEEFFAALDAVGFVPPPPAHPAAAKDGRR
ncbi:7-cyano-7-deazaguanine synthase [Parafrankia elaeagni]|uniref:7-cyano-7-deazaguanine synthase n=1 Tax=Parafrankia elaeagni TaxID=222534 RepID=UPI00039A8DDB|nr:7-cyano-7-deazaguanine synthase [Parafrankia elaeagni]